MSERRMFITPDGTVRILEKKPGSATMTDPNRKRWAKEAHEEVDNQRGQSPPGSDESAYLFGVLAGYLAACEKYAPRWMEVDDDLPHTQKMVLLHTPTSQRGKVQYGFYGWSGQSNERDWFVWTTAGWESASLTGKVVHWTPTPPPPGGEE